jgi:hypothetical protein
MRDFAAGDCGIPHGRVFSPARGPFAGTRGPLRPNVGVYGDAPTAAASRMLPRTGCAAFRCVSASNGRLGLMVPPKPGEILAHRRHDAAIDVGVLHVHGKRCQRRPDEVSGFRKVSFSIVLREFKENHLSARS